MALDTRIPLGVQYPNFAGNAMQIMSQGAQLQDARQGREMNALKIQQARSAIDDEGAIRNALRSAGPNPQDRVNSLYSLGTPTAISMAMELEKGSRQAAEMESKTAARIVAMQRDKIPMVLAGGPGAYQAWRAETVSALPNMASYFPENPDPSQIPGIMTQAAMDADKFIEQTTVSAYQGERLNQEGTKIANTEAHRGSMRRFRETEIANAGYLKSPEYLREAEAAKASGKAEVEHTIESEKQDDSRSKLSGLLDEMRTSYEDLNAKKGIVSTQRPGRENVLSSIRSSTPGQFVGRYTGTKEQELRNRITTARPLLIQLIRESTGMSSKQMDSNRELQFYLESATDPKLGYEVNMNALDRLNEMFGTGEKRVAPGVSGASGEWEIVE